MRTAIIDNNEKDADVLTEKIKFWGEQNQMSIFVDTYHTCKAFLLALEAHQYDLVFMDTFRQVSDSLAAVTQMRKNIMNNVLIFLTGSKDYIFDAFLCHAFDYLLKPFDDFCLFQALDEAVPLLLDSTPYINLPQGKLTIPVLYTDILCVQADSNYCNIQTTSKLYRCRITFGHLSEILNSDNRFCTINRGIIVNLDFVLQMENGICYLKNGQTLPLNHRKKKELMQKLIEYRFTYFTNQKGARKLLTCSELEQSSKESAFAVSAEQTDDNNHNNK